MRLGEAQPVHDVLGHAPGRRGRERQHRHAGQLFAQLGDAQVGGAEIVAPLRNAVRLVHGQQRHLHPLHPQAESLGDEPLRSHVEELHVAVDAVVERDVDLPGRQARMHRHGGDPPGAQPVDLILHQGDQRRHDDAQPFARQGRHLVRERFSAAGGHQRERIAPGQDRKDDPLLHGPERVESPVTPQRVVYFLFSDRLHDAKVTIAGRKAKARPKIAAACDCRAKRPPAARPGPAAPPGTEFAAPHRRSDRQCANKFGIAPAYSYL